MLGYRWNRKHGVEKMIHRILVDELRKRIID